MSEREYLRKKTTPEIAVGAIASGETLIHGMAAGEPPGLLTALAERLRAKEIRKLSVYSLLPMQTARDTILAEDLADVVDAHCWFVSAADRDLIARGSGHFVPNEFHEVPRLIRDYMEIDSVITMVSPMDRAGFFTFGTSNDFVSTAARLCKRLIVEVNPNMPRVFGDSLLHVSEVDAIVEHTSDLPVAAPAVSRPESEPIGRAIAELIPDGACIQLGVGGIPNAVASFLEGHKDLGIHTELFCPGMVDLIEKGVANGRAKNLHPRKHLFTTALGDPKMYRFLDDNPSVESYPVDYTNAPGVIAQNDKMISVNSTIEVDLTGQCNSEYLGGHQVSGTGGQLDYVRGAFQSRGGMSFIAFYSTADHGRTSRIVPRFEAGTAVTTPRMDTHYLVTEHGITNLKGRSTRERARAIIALAHPDFRDDLEREAREMDLL